MSAQEVLSALTGIYRHEMPETGELSQQNIKDCYYGHGSGLAMIRLIIFPCIWSLLGGHIPMCRTWDESIRTPYVGGLDKRINEQDLRDNFAHGEIESIKMVLNKACAFVTYTTREGAEKVAEELSNKPVIKSLRLKLMWGKP
ncbi:hypothetical protein Goarm_021802 [Gossypium armourianum]|uniref:RRM domain-containing protein n=1 Tax=Gossypium armourianum TaxID=34283 RepID=A0A7J9ITT9_9ROSI|nr:hypothetical protein [Gossypium armourianum]